MSTESADPRYIQLDNWSSLDAISSMAEGQMAAISAVYAARRELAFCTDAAHERLKDGLGRLVYVGAGTSGRVAVQDGVELHPTYGWSWERLIFAMAGGETALMRAVENAEDDFEAGRKVIIDNNIGVNDVIIGVAASGRTPYTMGAITEGKQKGALTLGFANNAGTPLLLEPDFSVFLDTGMEPIAGSTRMKAGTAQKVALNLFSTALMTRLGGVYHGLMVGMVATNKKLRNRAARIVSDITGIEIEQARTAVIKAGGDIKLGVLLALGYENLEEAKSLLNASGNNLRNAIKSANLGRD